MKALSSRDGLSRAVTFKQIEDWTQVRYFMSIFQTNPSLENKSLAHDAIVKLNSIT